MSIISVVYVPEGIAMSADSRLTGTKTSQINKNVIAKTIFTVSDNAQKLVLLNKVKVGIASCGNAIINGKTISDYIRLFEIEKVESSDDLTGVVNKLYEYSKPYLKGLEFLVCGYTDDVPYVYLIDEKEITRMNYDNNVVSYGACWRGRRVAANKLFSKDSFSFSLMPLKDGVDFSHFIVDLTIKYERFRDNIQMCGGSIDTLVLTKDKAFFFQHKIYNT